MSTKLEIITSNLDQEAPLFGHAEQQLNPQKATIVLNTHNRKLCTYYSEKSTHQRQSFTPVKNFNYSGSIFEWEVPANITRRSLKDFFRDENFLACCDLLLNLAVEDQDEGDYVIAVLEKITEIICDFVEGLGVREGWNDEEWFWDFMGPDLITKLQ